MSFAAKPCAVGPVRSHKKRFVVPDTPEMISKRQHNGLIPIGGTAAIRGAKGRHHSPAVSGKNLDNLVGTGAQMRADPTKDGMMQPIFISPSKGTVGRTNPAFAATAVVCSLRGTPSRRALTPARDNENAHRRSSIKCGALGAQYQSTTSHQFGLLSPGRKHGPGASAVEQSTDAPHSQRGRDPAVAPINALSFGSSPMPTDATTNTFKARGPRQGIPTFVPAPYVRIPTSRNKRTIGEGNNAVSDAAVFTFSTEKGQPHIASRIYGTHGAPSPRRTLTPGRRSQASYDIITNV